jgi:hypothetical protein
MTLSRSNDQSILLRIGRWSVKFGGRGNFPLESGEYFLKPPCRHVGTNKHENLFSGEIDKTLVFERRIDYS